MAVVHEHDDGDGGSSAAVVAIFLIALIVILAILFYGFAVGQWFGVGGSPTILNNPAAAPRPTAPWSPPTKKFHPEPIQKEKRPAGAGLFSCLPSDARLVG